VITFHFYRQELYNQRYSKYLQFSKKKRRIFIVFMNDDGDEMNRELNNSF